MSAAIKIIIVLAICGGAFYWYHETHKGDAKTEEKGSGGGSAAGGAGGGSGAPGDKNAKNQPPAAIPVAISHVREKNIPIYLDGLGTVQAFQQVTVRSQVEGVIEKIDFTEGQEVNAGDRLALVDARLYQAQLDQALAKKLQDDAKTQQDKARITQDQAKKTQDEALIKTAEARKAQDEALQNQASAKKTQNATNLANARVNLGRFEESRKENAVSEQVVTDQRSLVSQLESQIQSDEASIQSIAATVKGDQTAIDAAHAQVASDVALIQADEALVKGDEAAVVADDAAIEYAKTYVSYATIKSPIHGRTGVRQVDAGNLVRTNDTNGSGIVVVTQLQPISIIFTLPQQNLQAINAKRAMGKLKVQAVDSDKKVIDEGDLLLVDNQIDPATGTIKLKATFPNAKFQLWPGGFVNTRLLLETRENALVVSSPSVQQGPDGTFVFLIKPDSTVEMRPIKVSLIQDGRAILESGLQKDDQVVLSGQDRLKNGSKVTIDKNKQDKPAKDTKTADAPTNSKKKSIDEVNGGSVSEETNAAGSDGAATGRGTSK